MKIGSGFKRIFRALVLAAGLVMMFQGVYGQTKAQITKAVDPAQRKILGNTVHPLANSANDRGRADSSLPMKDIVLLLQPTQAQEKSLQRYIDDLHNANSSSFHKWLTPEQYAAQFGAADADIKTVSDWLRSNGFAIEQVGRGKNWIRFSGTSSQVEAAFKTSVHQYSVEGAIKYANATPLSIPAALAPAVTGVVSINNFLSHPQHVAPALIARDKAGKLVRATDNGSAPGIADGSDNTKPEVSPAFTSAGGQEENYLAPADFAKIYNTEPLVSAGMDGSGVSIAIVGRSDINLSDIEAFRTISGLPFNDPNFVYATTDPGDVSGDDVEATLDVEWSGAVAPQAKINYVIGASTTTTDGVDISAAYAVDNVVAPILSVSFGLCEANVSDAEIAFYQALWQQAAAEGITVFVSSGDSGASGCNAPSRPYTTDGFGVNGLASSPYDVAVGGTEFNDSVPNTYWKTSNGAGLLSAKGYIPEAVWNESCDATIAPSFTNCNFPPYYLYSYSAGGGASSCAYRTYDDSGQLICTSGYAKPSWQVAPGVPADGVRDLPDLSLAAAAEHDGYILCVQGSCQWTSNSDGSITLQQAAIVGGTSAAAPSMAGIMALVEQKHGQFQGVANYQLYKLAAAQDATACDASKETDPTQTNACVFHDITTGSNAVACVKGSPDCHTTPGASVKTNKPEIVKSRGHLDLDGYSAAAGYDLASGLGSINAVNLVNAWGTSSTLASQTTLSVSQTSLQHGTSVALSAKVAPASGNGTPSGDVLLRASTVGSLQSGALSAGTYSANTINLPGGTYNLTAQYTGDATYSASTSQPVAITVTPEDSVAVATTFAISPFFILGKQPILPRTSTGLGRPFWIQVQVNGVSGSTGATGTIELLNGSNSLGTFPLSKTGQIYVQCGPGTPCDLAVGSYNFVAKYSGDASFHATTVSNIPFTVDRGVLNWAVILNNQTPPVGGKVIASVYFNNDPLVLPTGTVVLSRSDTGAVLTSGKIDKTGVATIPFTAPAGDFTVNGTYNGDSNYIAGFQEIGQELIANAAGAAGVQVTLNTGTTAASLGQHTQFSVAVTPAQASNKTPVGTVTLYSFIGQISAPVALSGGRATGFVEWDQVGAQHVYAVYSGDFNYAAGNSGNSTVTVAQAQPIVTLQTLAGIVAVGAQASITASLTSTVSSTNVLAPTGTIQFFDAVNGGVPQPIGTAQAVASGNGGALVTTIAPILPQGSNVISAVYSGDVNWKSVTSATTAPIVVTTPTFSDTATPNPLIVTAGETSTITVNTQSVLGFNSQIALSCGGTLPVGVSCGSATVNAGGSGSLSLTTIAPGVSSASAVLRSTSLWNLSGTVALAGLFLICIPNRRRFYHLSVALLALGIAGGLAGCGGGSAKATTLVISSSNSKVASGSSVTLQATVQSSNRLKGTVTFYDGSTALGSPTAPVNGVATMSISSLGVGTHAITAKYSGDSGNTASASSDVLAQTVTGGFTVMINATSGAISQSLTIPATLQ